MVGNHTHFVGIGVIAFARNFFELIDNRLEQRDFKDIERADRCSRNTLEAAAKVDVFLFELFESTVLLALVLHKNLVADLHETGAVGGWMSETVFLNVLLIIAKIIKHLRVWATWIAKRSGLDATATAPPVFVVVVEENMLALFDAALVAVFGGADFGDLGIDASFFENFLPDMGSLFVFWDAVFFVANKTGDVDFVWVEADDFS